MRRREGVPLYHVVIGGLAAVFVHFTVLRAVDRAASSVERAAGVRLQAGSNEWRGQMSDERAQYATRDEMGARLTSLADKQDVSTARANTAEGRDTGTSATWAIIAAVVGMTIAVGGLLVAAAGVAVTVLLTR